MTHVQKGANRPNAAANRARHAQRTPFRQATTLTYVEDCGQRHAVFLTDAQLAGDACWRCGTERSMEQLADPAQVAGGALVYGCINTLLCNGSRA